MAHLCGGEFAFPLQVSTVEKTLCWNPSIHPDFAIGKALNFLDLDFPPKNNQMG